MIRDLVSLGLGDSGLNVLHLSLQVCQLLIQQCQPAACNIRVYIISYIHTYSSTECIKNYNRLSEGVLIDRKIRSTGLKQVSFIEVFFI